MRKLTWLLVANLEGIKASAYIILCGPSRACPVSSLGRIPEIPASTGFSFAVSRTWCLPVRLGSNVAVPDSGMAGCRFVEGFLWRTHESTLLRTENICSGANLLVRKSSR